MIRKISAQGFSTVAIIIALVVIAATGFAGWQVWQNRDKKQSNNTHQTSGSSSPETKDQENSTPLEANQYLIIDEWNLRVTLPENLRGDISYFVNDRAEKDFGGPVLIDFVSKKFSAGSLRCAEIEDLPRSLVSIERQFDSNGVFRRDVEPFKQIGGARYYFVGTGCEETIEREGSNEDKQLLASVKKAIQDTLENY